MTNSVADKHRNLGEILFLLAALSSFATVILIFQASTGESSPFYLYLAGALSVALSLLAYWKFDQARKATPVAELEPLPSS